jgi:hypothetical protein
MDGTSILENNTEVKAIVYNMDNPKLYAKGTIIDSEIYPCGMVLYTVRLHNGKEVFRCANEIVLL